MRLHILSDLHLEFGPVEIPSPDADLVVLAGDIHLGHSGVEWARRQFPHTPILYVLGNHEFYRHSLPGLTEALKRETDGGQIHLLENNTLELDGFTFLGCTLWTDFRLGPDKRVAMLTAEDIMSDYQVVRFDAENRWLRARDTERMHSASVTWLKKQLHKHEPARTVIVTHHAPSQRSIPPNHAGSALNGAFVSDLDALVENSGVPLWIHGHTHYNVDYSIGNTRVLSNQRGYPQEGVNGFEPGLILEI
jgi:predicted phosphodiesterase